MEEAKVINVNFNWYAVAGSALAGLGAGFALGTYLERRRSNDDLEQIVDDIEAATEMAEEAVEEAVITLDDIRAKRERAAREEHPSAEKPQVLKDLEESQTETEKGFVIPAEEYENIVKNPRRDPSEIVGGIPLDAEDPEPEVDNIWDGVDNSIPDWDWDQEKQHREDIPHDVPYILHRDEYFNEETHYGQTTLTYYAKDNKLTDEKDVPLYNMGDVVGDCLRFGHGSGDPHVVYIRNNKLHAEYEVVMHEGAFDEEILGIEAQEALEEELMHSEHRVLKFRDV